MAVCQGRIELCHYHYGDFSNARLTLTDADRRRADSTIAAIDSLCALVNANQAQILQRQADLVNDIRQETNNNLDKMAAWLSFWIAIIAIVGAVLPFAFQYFVMKREEAKFREMKREFQRTIDNKQRDFESKIEEFKAELDNFRCQLESLDVKAYARSMIVAKENRVAFEESGSDIEHIYLARIRDEINDFRNRISEIHNWNDTRVSLLTLIIGVDNYLTAISHTADRFHKRKIDKLKDRVRRFVSILVKAGSYADVKTEFNAVCKEFNEL